MTQTTSLDAKYHGFSRPFTFINLSQDVFDFFEDVVFEGSKSGDSFKRQSNGKMQG